MPIQDLMDYEKCYTYLSNLLHPSGLHCTCGCPLNEHQRPHKYRANGLPCFRCRTCGKVFNLFTQTIFQGIHYDCIKIVLILRGFAKGESTQHLSDELQLSYNNLLNWRHLLQEYAFENRSMAILADTEVESDAPIAIGVINAGEKGDLHPTKQDPPRKRANKKKALALLPTTVRPFKDSLVDKVNKSV